MPLSTRSFQSRRPHRQIFVVCLLAICCLPGIPQALAGKPGLDKVTLQLQWTHQFQFAGYYAAKKKGFYRDAGLDVELLELKPGVDSVQEVADGRADFGVGETSLLLARQEGKPVVVLANIFQHSALALAMRHEGSIDPVHTLKGKRVMLDGTDAEIVAFLTKEGLPPKSYDRREHSLNTQDLLAGKVDAVSVYLTEKHDDLEKAGVPCILLTPRSAGIDFYGDNLFTSEAQIREHPERVAAFRDASLKGWEYAMDHAEEIIDLILSNYSNRVERDHLAYEAEQTKELIQPDLVHVGYVNPGRWKEIARTYAGLGMLPRDFDLAGFIYQPDASQIPGWLIKALAVVAVAVFLGLLLLLFLLRANRRLVRSEKNLADSEARSRQQAVQINSLLDAIPDVVFFKNTEGVYLGCNPAFIEIAGRPKNEIIGKKDHELFDREAADWFQEQDLRMMTAREPIHIEEWVTYPDGRRALHDTYKAPYLDPDGKLIGVLGLSRDITERKKAEEALARSAERLALATDAGGVGIWDYDVPNNTLTWDAQMFALYGIARDQFGGAYEAWKAGVHPDDRLRGDAEIQMAIRGEKEFDTEFRVLWPDGTVRNIRAIAKVTRDASGTPLRMTGTNWDITEQKQSENEILQINRQLAEATAKAERATAAKSEFLATMTHELRNPLSGILGFAEILADTPLDEEQQSYTEAIKDSGDHLLSLINDVLDFSSIEKGVLAIHPAPFALAGLVKSSAELIRKSAADKGVAFHCEVAAGVPGQITGDERRIRQILINLLANAVKFTSDGSVSLRVTGSGEFVEFSVEDTGIGISSEALARLFQLFTQADSSINKKYGGTGIGLAVSQRLAESMGGSISIVSAPGKGSTFTFRLPLEPGAVRVGGKAAEPSRLFIGADGASPSSPSAEAPERPALPPVLVVEDDRSNTVIVGKMLQSLGYRVEFATNGTEAVEAFAPGKYLAILMDLRMPVMNGLEATGIIRSRESGSRVPIIALTANLVSSDHEINLPAGMDGFLAKPFTKAELAAKLSAVVGDRT